MVLFVLGATGPTGQAILSLAPTRGHRVRALARDPRALPAREGVEVVQGDVRDVGSLARGLVGVDAVVGVFGVSGLSRAFQPTDLYSVGIRNLIAAMREVGTRRVVMVSSSAVVYDAGAGLFWTRLLRPMMWPMYADMSTMELLLTETELDWTVVRPPQLIDGAGGGRRVVTGDVAAGSGFTLTRGQLAEALVEEVETGRYLRQRIIVAGDT